MDKSNKFGMKQQIVDNDSSVRQLKNIDSFEKQPKKQSIPVSNPDKFTNKFNS